jgi:hypothetical protein
MAKHGSQQILIDSVNEDGGAQTGPISQVSSNKLYYIPLKSARSTSTLPIYTQTLSPPVSSYKTMWSKYEAKKNICTLRTWHNP